ncbi:MAG: lipoyl(octanoyl) transferase LipB [Hyphomicrobiaceae bacterium]|nr:MAG: lipoyl(octanoyl) transferase LipB [Hyphomicrobiaceae bacterium]
MNTPLPPVEWISTPGLVPYEAACAFMAERVDAIAAGTAAELIWLIEHPPLYTAGTSAKTADLLEPGRFPVHATGRGGQYTYHGPGQRVGYVMLDVKRRFGDVRAYVGALEAWIIETLADLGIEAGTVPGRVGVWVARSGNGRDTRDKIAAIGVRLRRWVSSHGFSLNVAPDLAHFSGIVPCGIHDDGVTSLADLGSAAGLADVDKALRAVFERRFGTTRDGDARGLPPLLGAHQLVSG